jgi:NADH-ubiquinone oxidoreductase chain 5
MYLLVLAIPALSAFVTGFFGKLLGKNGVQVINISCMIITFIVSSIIFYEVALLKYTCFIDLGLWFNLGSAKVNFEFLFDTITATMLLAVSLVSLLVHIYSLDYMGEDPHFIRFMTYLTVFTLFMFVLLTSGNFIQFFTGWEGVGLASYLLINFWFTRTQANTSALKALIVNRFGDFALYTAILIIFLTFKTLNFYTIFALNNVFTAVTFDIVGFQINIVELICLFLFIGAVGKSAQVGLHVWLPDAMEGPTPVSALIHAATMVTAGVFLIIRCSPLFEYAPNVLVLVTVTGALTAFFAASVGLVQNDLKKVIAYSTCSQLGYMVFACGSSGYAVGFFHLVNHAFFKALLFLCAGSVIHSLLNEQDVRRMGGIVKILPLTYVMMLAGSLSLMGFPYLTGFYSKDAILEFTFAANTSFSLFAYLLGILSAFFTAFYSWRLLHLTFFANKTNTLKSAILTAHESPRYMLFAFFPLMFGSIFWGYLTKDMFIGLGSDFWQTSIFVLPQNQVFIDAEFLPITIKIIPLILSLSGMGFSFLVYYGYNNLNFLTINNNFLIYAKIISFLNKKWYFDLIYNQYIVKTYFFISYFITFKLIDRGVLEFFGPLGVVRQVDKISALTMKLHSGVIYRYVLLIILALLISLFIFF